MSDGVQITGTINMSEQADSGSSIATLGQFWIHDTAPNTPMFTDDTGNDLSLSSSLYDSAATLRLAANTTGVATLYSNASTDTEIRNLSFAHQNGTQRAAIGYTAAGATFYIRSEIHGAPLTITAEDAGGTPRPGFSFDPDADTDVTGDVNITLWNAAGVDRVVEGLANAATTVYYNGAAKIATTTTGVQVTSSLFLTEQASSAADVGGDGQVWVENKAPNRLMFTNDAGNDYVVAIAGGTSAGNVNVNGSFNFNTANNFADNYIGHHFDGGADTITLEDSTSTTNWPLYSTITMICPGSGVITVTEGSGTTLYDDTGTDTVGGVTVSQGVVSITRQSTTNYIIWGSGIT